MSRVIDLTGMRFGRLVVLYRCENKNGGRFPAWTCVCDCGNIVDILGCNLRTGNTKSCGCYRELCRSRYNIKHGYSNHHLRTVYSSMKDRCYNPNSDSYRNYGARGIKICDEWNNDYASFVRWALDNGYEFIPDDKRNNMLSIDRIDCNGPYSPENCRWADRITQANNKLSITKLTYMSETHSVAEWGRILGINASTIRYRLKHEWSVEDALSKEVQSHV